MPDFMTHTVFAEETFKQFSHRNIIKDNLNILILGAQGPDPFFYHGFYPWMKSNSFIGGHIHSNHTQSFLINYINYVKDSKNKDTLFPHLFGLICHYYLDHTAHPYIFHVTGVYDKKDLNTYKYRGLHLLIEKSIDALFIEKYYNKKPHKYKIYKQILPQKEVNVFIVDAMNKVIKDTFNLENFGLIYKKSIKHMKTFYKIVINDQYGLKKPFYKIVNKLFNKTGKNVFQYFSIYKTIDKNIDYLNLSKKEWIHPQYSNIKSNESFLELFEKAKNNAVNILEKVYDYVFNDKDINLKELIPDLSYSTGLDWRDNKKMEYFNIIF